MRTIPVNSRTKVQECVFLNQLRQSVNHSSVLMLGIKCPFFEHGAQANEVRGVGQGTASQVTEQTEVTEGEDSGTGGSKATPSF